MDLRAPARAAVIVLASCGPAQHPDPHVVTQAEWTHARAMLDGLRERSPKEGYLEQIAITLHEPFTKKTFQARGAVAVLPGTAMRMILIGPAGVTALDAWVTRDRWRFHVPMLGPAKRGTAAPPELPIDFFRWWFIDPWSGRLLWAHDGALVLREGSSTIAARVEIVRPHSLHVVAERDNHETLDSFGLLFHPAPGDRARYTDRRTGLVVEVSVEGVSFEPPPANAFEDPDMAAGVSL